LYGIKFDYCKQKDAYADLEFLNDVGYLPDGTPMNMAGNCINHPERIQPDPHTPGSPLPRANLHNSVGYLPDGTAMNAAGNALNHPERMQPDMHVAGSPLPKSVYYADVGYFADGTDLTAAGNNFKAAPPVAFPTPAAPSTPVVTSTPVAASFVGSTGDALYGIKFDYCKQKDAYADLEFLNDVGYLPDGTPMNMAGNCINHPERIQPDPHTPGSPLPRANLHNSVGYLPDGTAMNAAGNALNHPERMQPDMHVAGSPLPKSVYYADVGYFADGTDLTAAGNNFAKVPAVAATTAPKSPAAAAAFAGTSVPKPTFRQPGGFAYSVQKDVYADFLFSNDVGYLPDGTPMNKAGNAMNHPERIQADPHTNGSPLPRANFANDVGYLPDGTPMNRAGNALNHPERLAADAHAPGSSLPASQYAADVGYLVDGTPLDGAGNNAVH